MKALWGVLFICVLLILAFIGGLGPGPQYFFEVIVPYLAILTFVAGTGYRVVNWARAPVPFHVPTVCGQQKSLDWLPSSRIESPNTTLGVSARLALEILLFRSLFRNERVELKKGGKLIYGGNRYLWLGGLIFHWSLLIILTRHTRLLIEPVPSFIVFIQNLDGAFTVLFLSDVLIIAALSYLFIRRVVYPQMRYLSLPADYLALLLLVSVALSGVLMRVFHEADVVKVKTLAMSVLTLHPAPQWDLGIFFGFHLLAVCALLAYFPFSKMMHMAGIFLSPTRNLKNDSRSHLYINPVGRPVKVHTYAEYEDEFRDAMREVGLPLEKDEHAGP